MTDQAPAGGSQMRIAVITGLLTLLGSVVGGVGTYAATKAGASSELARLQVQLNDERVKARQASYIDFLKAWSQLQLAKTRLIFVKGDDSEAKKEYRKAESVFLKARSGVVALGSCRVRQEAHRLARAVEGSLAGIDRPGDAGFPTLPFPDEDSQLLAAIRAEVDAPAGVSTPAPVAERPCPVWPKGLEQ